MRILSVLLLFGCGVATADTFLIKSADGGRTWTDVDPGPPYRLLESFSVDWRTSTLYTLTRKDSGPEGHLSISIDGGETWHSRHIFPPSPAAWDILAAAGPDALYLAHEEGVGHPRSPMITRIADDGQTVEQYRAEGLIIVDGTAANLCCGYLARLAVAPAARLYAITNEFDDLERPSFQALWASADGGRNWKRLEPPISPDCGDAEIWIDPSDSSTYLRCGAQFLKSADGGESWTRKPLPGGGWIDNLQIGPGAPAILYALVRGSAIFRSTDGAGTWQRCGNLPPEVAGGFQVDPRNPSVILGAGNTGFWKSENGGATWTKWAAYGAMFNIRVDPRAPDTLYGWSYHRQEPRLNGRQTFLRNLAGEKQIAPGSLVSIYGKDLAKETRVAGSAPLPLTLGGASVSFDGRPAPLLFVSPDQINAQVPFGLKRAAEGVPATSVTMEVRRHDASLDRQTVSLSPQAVFVLRESPTRQSAPLLFHAVDLRRVGPGDPLRRGEAITLFALGMGELEPALAAGELAPTSPLQLANPGCLFFAEASNRTGRVLMPAPPQWAGAAPGLIGVYQVNFEIPASLDPGSYLLALTDGNSILPADIAGKKCVPGYQGYVLDFFTIEVQ